MADRFDKSYARRPSADNSAHRDDTADLPEDDPLVELARIVSGNESFDQILGSRYQQQAEPPHAAAPPVRGAPQQRDTSYDLEAELLNDLHSSFDPDGRRQQAGRAAEPAPVRPVPRAAAAPRAENFDHMTVRPSAPAAPSRPAAAPAAAAPEPYVAAPDFGRGRVPPEAMQRRPAPPAAAAPVREEDEFDDDYIDDDDLRADYDDADDGYVDETDFEAEPPRRSRKALITAGVVLVVLVVGGLAAFALKGRTSISGGTPQVIAADQGPTKIEPEVQPPQNQDAQQNKLIYDRADPDKASPDQLQLPEDSAADATAQSNESQASREISRIILPGGPGDQSTTPAVPGAADSAGADSGDDTGPRKVRTVVVKPDGTIVSSEAAPRGAAPSADVATAEAPPAVEDQPPVAAAPPEDAPADNAPVATDNAPMLAPTAPAKDNSQLAAPAPVAAAPTVAPPAAEAPPAPSSGGFVVQVSSQRSEAAAAAAYKNLQRKFPSVMGDRAPDIARADLGAKGVYYRARVGPMATRDEAVNFCEQLRAAGGDCIVQKN